MAEKTELEKSHSKSSNALLTIICLLTALFLAFAIVSLSYYLLKSNDIALIAAIASGCLTVLGTISLLIFKR